jgi:hypothetical protein
MNVYTARTLAALGPASSGPLSVDGEPISEAQQVVKVTSGAHCQEAIT